MITFVCVLRIDEDLRKKQPVPYDKEWVNKLYRAVQRNYKNPFRFVCLSNVDTDVETIPLVTDWKGWWSKVELFRPGLFNGPVVYFDLDVLLCKDFSNFFNGFNEKNFHMLLEPPKNTPNSSIMYWDGDYSYIWDKCYKNYEEIFSKYWKKNNPVIGDQGFIYDETRAVFLNDIEDPCFNWRSHLGDQNNQDPMFYVFTSKHEKPYNNIDLDIVRKNWI